MIGRVRLELEAIAIGTPANAIYLTIWRGLVRDLLCSGIIYRGTGRCKPRLSQPIAPTPMSLALGMKPIAAAW
jgi:hypothetical protein